MGEGSVGRRALPRLQEEVELEEKVGLEISLWPWEEWTLPSPCSSPPSQSHPLSSFGMKKNNTSCVSLCCVEPVSRGSFIACLEHNTLHPLP